MRKLLITGGAGFIGSNFIRHWLISHPKDHIVNFDKLTYAGNLTTTNDFSKDPRYRFIKGDITEAHDVEKAMYDIDLVVHFAAESHVDRSIKFPRHFVETNVLGTQILLEAATKHRVKHFHHVSTDEVFGSLSLTTKKIFSETSPYDPRSPYSASKASSDHLVRAWWHTYKLPVTITNCSNNFGPFQHPEKLIPRFITNLLLGKKVPVYGDGKYVRDWLHVIDHCRAIEAVIEKGQPGATYCVGGQKKQFSNFELTEMILKIMGKTKDYLTYVADRPANDRRYAVDWSKINHDLGWEPKHDLETWLADTVDWYKNNSWWWEPLKVEAEIMYQKKGLSE